MKRNKLLLRIRQIPKSLIWNQKECIVVEFWLESDHVFKENRSDHAIARRWCFWTVGALQRISVFGKVWGKTDRDRLSLSSHRNREIFQSSQPWRRSMTIATIASPPNSPKRDPNQ
jgi:hypothetical protein